MKLHFLIALVALCAFRLSAQQPPNYEEIVQRLLAGGLGTYESHSMLAELTIKAPHRLSGSVGAAKAVQLTKEMMEKRGFDNVHLEPVMVPRWVRGPVEEAAAIVGTDRKPLTICALGGSIATPAEGITAEVIEVKTFDELRSLGEKAKNKVILFNRAFDNTKLNQGEAYGGAVDQRSRGAVEASKAGALAALVRSMTSRIDDVPHTGAMNYVDSVKKVPSAAISTLDANMLSELIKINPGVRVYLKLTCETLPDVESANVVGDITGWEKPNEIVMVCGHLDAWDKGTGAHDDGAGCVQAIEALNLIKRLGLKPRRTLRAVMFMNEENGTRGARAYPVAKEREGEKHIAALESDAGGHAPRGISVQADSVVLAKMQSWKPLFKLLLADNIEKGGSGVDIGPLAERGVPAFGLRVETHRYFDYHHSDNDTIDKVHPRELEMGAIVEALWCWLISEEGL